MRALLWGLGMAMGIAIGTAIGGSFVRERGRNIVPVVVALTLATGVLIGWALNGQLDAIQASSSP